MTRPRVAVTLLVLVAGSACTAVPAPDLAPPGPASAGAALRRVPAGAEIRLHLAGSGEVRGRLGVLTDDSVGVATADGPRLLGLPAVDTVWVHRDRARTAGRGLLGGVVVGGALALLGMIADCHQCDDPGLGRVVAPYLLAIGASAGALIGSAGAGLAPTWSRAFPAVRSPRPW